MVFLSVGESKISEYDKMLGAKKICIQKGGRERKSQGRGQHFGFCFQAKERKRGKGS